jgi:hypothetical protein
MNTIYQSEQGSPVFKQNVLMTTTTALDAVDAERAARLDDCLALSARQLADKGALRVDTDYDAAKQVLRIVMSGVPGVRLLEYQHAEHGCPFEENTPVSVVVEIDPLERHKLIGIADHLMSVASLHPQKSPPLSFKTEYDEPNRRARVMLSGGVFAVTYLFTIVYLHLTQSRT